MDSAVVGGRGDNTFLVRLRRLTRLGDSDLAALELACGPSQTLRSRTDLIRERDRPQRVHILHEGWACRYKLLPDGRRQIANLILPGDVCNPEQLHVAECCYGVATLTACTFADLPLGSLRGLAARHPAIGEAFAFLTAVDNGILTERTASLGRRSARERLAHLLCEVWWRLTLAGQVHDLRYVLPITQEEIGDVLGLTSVHVNRVLQRLRAEQIIGREGQAIVLHDWELLQRVAAFRATYLGQHADGGEVRLSSMEAAATGTYGRAELSIYG